MARLLKQSEAKRLGLPGRVSLEPVSGEIGSRVSFRIATIAVPQPGDSRAVRTCIAISRNASTFCRDRAPCTQRAASTRSGPATFSWCRPGKST